MLSHRVPFPLFVGGYGCGKSEILVINAIRDVMSFVGCKVGCYAPTLDLLELNLIPRIEEHLDALGIAHNHNKSKHILHIRGNRKIYFRSMDNPARIVSYEVYRSHVDEADLMATIKKGFEVWGRIISRNRQKRTKGKSKTKTHKKHFNMVSAYTTPESFKFTYKRWKKEPGVGYKYVRAPTSSNWTLDESFIANLMDSYTPEQCKAYLQGIWTNIFTGTVYSYYDRDVHNTTRIVKPKEPLIIGCDFNYGGTCGSVYVEDTGRILITGKREPSKMIMVNELVAYDTPELIKSIQDNYAGHQIDMYPDATGNKGSTNASVSDIAMLRAAKFGIHARGVNPRIPDRINAVQRMLYAERFKINVDMCPQSAAAMEEHAFSEITGLPEKFAGAATIDDRNDAMGYPVAYRHPIKKQQTTTTELYAMQGGLG